MVAASQNATTDTSRFSKFINRKKCGNDSLRWRSTGWTPLAYPASALFVDSTGPVTTAPSAEVNPYFPLDKDVLRAAIRELLILDGSLDADTLTLKEDLVRFGAFDTQKANVVGVCPLYAFHLQPGKWKRLKEEVAPPLVEKRDGVKTESEAEAVHTSKRKPLVCTGDSKRRLKRRIIDDREDEAKTGSPLACKAKSYEIDTADDMKVSVSSAAVLVDVILERGRRDEQGACFLAPSLSSAQRESLVSSSAPEQPLRKVSDVDQSSLSDCPPVLLDVTEETCGEHDISLFIDFVNRKEKGSVALVERDIPALLDVSIVFELSLRNAAYRMLHHMYSSFDSEALRLFLGYKSSALKRERVLRILSDYLFDVSHAMFAWKQTESEILSERTDSSLRTQTSFCQEIDSVVRDSLFDERALKKIGGLDDASILRHAIEISRSERRSEPWETFAKTATGRRLLSHHRSGRACLVGQKRRGQRIKRFSSAASTDASEGEQRSRASSIASYDDDENSNRGYRPENAQQQLQQSTTPCSTIQNLSEVLDLTLTRNIDETWGVLLSREGDLCVVERAPEESTVRCGDMVLSVTNDRGESAAPPASSGNNDNPGWFQDVVNVFKGSNELHLVVRRVGCGVAT